MTVYKKESILSQGKLLSNVVVDKIANECQFRWFTEKFFKVKPF